MKVLHINAGLEKGGGLSHIVNLLTEAKRQNVDFELLTLADGPVAKAAKKAKVKTTIFLLYPLSSWLKRTKNIF